MKTCLLIHDEIGWWMQYKDEHDKTHVALMDALDETDAQLEAREEGYTPDGVIHV